jgi:hypothetical protein
MKRWIWIALAALLVVAPGLTLVAVPRGPEWTTSSPEALAEFEMECLAHYSEMANREAWRQILDERSSECVTGFRSVFAAVVTHRTACRVGDWETVQAIEDEAAGSLLEAEGTGDSRSTVALQATVHHMQGVRLASQGEFGAAAERFRAANQRLSFIEVDTGMYKLYNLMFLVETMLADGEDAEAHKLLAHVRSTNPAMVAEFETSGFRLLGLGRG